MLIDGYSIRGGKTQNKGVLKTFKTKHYSIVLIKDKYNAYIRILNKGK